MIQINGVNIMKSKLGFICTILLFLLTSCDNKDLKEILQGERIGIFVHQEEVDNGVVIFYMPNLIGEPAKASFEARFIQKNLFDWKETFDMGGTSGTLERNLYSQYLPKYSGRSPFPMLFGEITDPNIEVINVEYGQSPKVIEAKSVKKNGKHFWFIFVDEPKEKIIYTIKGYSINGELLETVEQESEPLSKNYKIKLD